MGHRLPFKRNCRCFLNGKYSGDTYDYTSDPQYSKNPEHYIRAFLLIQKDLLSLFDYIEPADNNLKTYSFRISELLFRICAEIESNFKAILYENGYPKTKNLNIQDYMRLDASHRLSSYFIRLPHWTGSKNTIQPFITFAEAKSPAWHLGYTGIKHDRYSNFRDANLQNLLGAMCGLVTLLSSQFYRNDFDPITYLATSSGPKDEYKTAIGNYFLVRFPDDWSLEERYDFSWSDIQGRKVRFNKLFDEKLT